MDEVALPTDSRTTRILLVVGEPTLRISFLSRFRLMGIDVEVASNGELALEKLRRNQIDAVFLDLMLRETDSAKVIKKIRKDREFAALPVFGYASAFSARQIKKVTKAGATKVFDENGSSIDAIVAEISSELFDGVSDGEFVQEIAANGSETPDQLLESVNRVQRHLEQMANLRGDALAVGYGELRGKVQRVTNLSMRAGRYDMARLSSGLQSVLKVYHEIPEHATESSFHTVTVAVEVLATISTEASLAEGPHALEFTAAIVDDEMVSRSIVCSALRSVGFTFEVFTHPAEILRHAASHKTDLVVVNMCAEETAGFDVCQRLRDQKNTENTPVLFVSGISEFRDRKKVISSGADEVITKPFIFMELSLKALSLALRNRFATKDDPENSVVDAESDAAVSEEQASGESLDRSPSAVAEEDVAEMDFNGLNRIAEHQRGVNSSRESGGAEDFDALLLNDVMNSLIAPTEPIAGTHVEPRLEESLAQKETDREETIASIEENDGELARVHAALQEEREQREQLEIMVQQLMEGQGNVEPESEAVSEADIPDGSVQRNIDGVEADGQAAFDNLPPEIQEEMDSLASLADELRVELEGKEAARAQLNEQLNSTDVELSNIRIALEQERIERESLQSKLDDADATIADSSVQSEALEEARSEIIKTAALVQEKSEHNEKLEAQLCELSEEFKKSTNVREELVAEREAKEKELNQQLLVAKTAAEESAARQQKEVENSNALQVEIDQLQETLESKQKTDEQTLGKNDQEKSQLETRLKEVRAELEQAKAEQKKLSEERGQNESKRAEQVATLKSETEQAETALQAESRKNTELESRLQSVSKELEESTAAQKKQAAEWDHFVLSLKKELEAAKELADEADERTAERARQVQKLEESLEEQRSEIDAKLACEVEQTSEVDRQRKELERRLREAGENLQQAEAVREKLLSERKLVESELQDQLKAAQSVATKTEAAAQKHQERNGRLESDVKRLTSQQKELESKLEAGLNQIQQLEKQKTDFKGELQNVRNELKRSKDAQGKLLSEREQFEAKSVKQLSNALAAAKKAEARAQRESKQTSELKKELEKLRGVQSGLEAKLKSREDLLKSAEQRGSEFESLASGLQKNCNTLKAELATGQKRLSELADKKTGLENQLESTRDLLKKAREQSESLAAQKDNLANEFDQQLEEYRRAAQKAEVVAKKETERGNKFEAEVTGLWQVRDDLQGKLATEQKYSSELNKSKTQLEAQVAEIGSQLDEAAANLVQKSGELGALEKQHAEISEARAALVTEVALLSDQQKTHKSEMASMERRVRENVGLLTRATADLETERGERQRTEQRSVSISNKLKEVREELNRQLQLEKDSQKRVAGLEKQIAEREQALEHAKTAHQKERNGRRKAEQQIGALSTALEGSRSELTQQLQETKAHQARVSELEQQLRVREESLVRVTEHLESERGERRRIEQRATELAAQFQKNQKELVARRESEKKQLSRISDLEEKLQGRDDALVESMGALETERSERGQLEKRNAEISAQVKTLNSDLNEALETEKTYRQRVAGMEKDIRDRKTELEQVRSELGKETADRQLAEEQIEAAEEISKNLAQYQAAFDESRQSFDQTQAELESRIEQGRVEIEEQDAKLRRESEERQQLEQALDSARKKVREMEQQSTIEVSKLRTALQTESMERRRLESDAVSSRYVSMNNNRSGQAMVNGLRKQMQTPVDQLMNSARQMLEFELQPELKKVAEGVLENALSIQTNVRESNLIDVDTADEVIPDEESNEESSK